MLRPKIEIIEKDTGYAKLKKELAEINGAFVKVGFPEGSSVGSPGSPGKTRRKKPKKPWDNMSEVARVATWNEFGVPEKNIPSRPFFRNAIDSGSEALSEFKKKIYDQFLLGRMTPKGALDNVGLWMQNRIRQSILKGSWTPNAPRTKRQKESSKPLIDTGQLVNSVSWINSLTKK
jgi:hypothetical protein